MKQLLYKTVFWAMLSLSFHRAGAQFFGIGTPLPQTTLDVAGTGPNHLIRLSDNSGVSAVRLALNSVFAGMPYIGTDNPTGFGIVANNLQLITASKVGNVGINTIYPNASAILDIESNNRGLLIPRMTGAQMAAIVAPATGLMVFDTDANTFYFFNGTAWSRVDTQSELERISEGGKTGYRILNRLPANYGDIGQEAVDLSFSGVVSSTLGATGSQSFATGQQTSASGTASTAMGFGTSAMGLVATAIGNLCTASGNYAVALGASNISAGTAATTLGLNNRATAAYSLAGGSNSRALGQSSFAMGEQGYTMGSNSAAIGTRDSAIGESSFAAGSNAAARGLASVAMGSFAKANGNYSFAAVRHSAALGISSVAMGQESVALGNHAIALSLGDSATGTASFAAGYFSKALGEYAVAIGREVEASGNSSLALGYQTLANGSSATAFGNGTLAIGSAATAMGFNTAARGSNSTAMGNGTNASGSAAMAMGFGTVAIGNNATAMGNATVAKSHSEVTIGSFNDTLAIANGTAFRADTNRLFTVGNGPSASNRRTAFVIQQDGAVGIGVRRPTSLLHVNGEVGINGSNVLELGADVAGKEINAGKIGYNTFTAEALDVVGAGNSLATRRIKLWAEGGLELAGTIVQENLQAPVLLGGWQNFGAAFATAGYWEDKEGMVHLRGLIGNGNASGGTTLFNLPAGYRPSGGRLIFTVLTSGGMGRVDVNTNGDVIIDNIPGNAWLNLTGISFRTN